MLIFYLWVQLKIAIYNKQCRGGLVVERLLHKKCHSARVGSKLHQSTVYQWHGKVPFIRFSCGGMLDFVEDCGLDVKTH